MDPSVHSCPTDAMGRAGMPNGFTVGDCPADDCGKIRAIFGWPALALGWSVCHGGNLLLHSSTSSAWSGQPKSQARAALRRGRPLTLTPYHRGRFLIERRHFPGIGRRRVHSSDASSCRLRCASLGGARHGFLPVRNGHDGHPTAMHLRTSSDDPAQQSRHLARIACIGDIAGWPIARSSTWVISRGSRPISQSSTPDGSYPA